MNNLLRRCFVLLAGLAACSGPAATALAANGMDQLSWLEGVWQTQPRNGAQSEYVYIPLFNGEMLSTNFSVNGDGQPTRYELRVIKVQDGQVIFHEVGFKPDLSIADPVPLRPLQSASSKQITFTDMQVTRTGANTATMELTIHPQGGAARTLRMQMTRTMRFVKAR